MNWPLFLVTSIVISALWVTGTYLVVRGRFRKQTLNAFYDAHPLVGFTETIHHDEQTARGILLMKGTRRHLHRLVQVISHKASVLRAISYVETQQDLAGSRPDGLAWIANVLLWGLGSVVVTILLVVVSGETLLVLLPGLVVGYQISRLRRRAGQRRQRIEREMPELLSYMAQMSKTLPGLEGARGAYSQTVSLLDSEASNVFARLQREAVVQREPIHKVFQRYSKKWNIPKFSRLAVRWEVHLDTGVNLVDMLTKEAATQRKDEARKLKSRMLRQSTAAVAPLILCDIPALLILLLSPAGFQIAQDLHL